MITFDEATKTIRKWINHGAVHTPDLARELSEWALWALGDGGEPTHAIVPVAEIDRLRAIEAAARDAVGLNGEGVGWFSRLVALRDLLDGAQ